MGVFAAFRPGLFRPQGVILPGVALGFLFASEFVALFLGLRWTSASHAVLFLYTAPFFLALALPFFAPGERLSQLQWMGLGLSFCGVAFALRVSNDLSPEVFFGDLLCLGAGGLWAATTVLMKTTELKKTPALTVMLYQVCVSTVVLGALALARGEQIAPSISLASWASLAFQSFWVVSVTYLIWFWMVGRYRAAELSSFTFLSPLIGVFAGALILGDPLTPNFLLAAALVAAGLLLVNWPSRRAA